MTVVSSLDDIAGAAAQTRVREWVEATWDRLLLRPEVRPKIRGVVFEVRQGYKSKDAGRQNKDIGNAANAYANLYVPVLLLFSTQIDGDVAARYVQSRWLLMRGTTAGPTTESTYTFYRDVLGYDLAAFSERNSARFTTEVESVLQKLLGA